MDFFSLDEDCPNVESESGVLIPSHGPVTFPVFIQGIEEVGFGKMHPDVGH